MVDSKFPPDAADLTKAAGFAFAVARKSPLAITARVLAVAFLILEMVFEENRGANPKIAPRETINAITGSKSCSAKMILAPHTTMVVTDLIHMGGAIFNLAPRRQTIAGAEIKIAPAGETVSTTAKIFCGANSVLAPRTASEIIIKIRKLTTKVTNRIAFILKAIAGKRFLIVKATEACAESEKATDAAADWTIFVRNQKMER